MKNLEKFLANKLREAHINRQSSEVVESVLAIKDYIALNPSHTLPEQITNFINDDQFDE